MTFSQVKLKGEAVVSPSFVEPWKNSTFVMLPSGSLTVVEIAMLVGELRKTWLLVGLVIAIAGTWSSAPRHRGLVMDARIAASVFVDGSQ